MRILLAFGRSLSFLVAFLLVTAPVQAGDLLPPAGTESHIRAIGSIDMISASKGWGWGEARVYRTIDGGAHFVDVTPSEFTSARSITELTATDATHAWVVFGSPNGQEPLTLYRTSNGGRTWTRVTVPPAAAGRFTFIDPSHGWMQTGRYADNHRVSISTLRRTTDGGRTWSVIYQARVRIPIEPNVQRGGCEWSSLTFSSAMHGIVGLPCDHSAVLRTALTNDGGKTWRRVRLPSFPHPTGIALNSTVGQPYLSGDRGTVFADLCVGTSMTCYDYGALYRTADGGRSWHRSSVAIHGAPTAVFAGATHVWLPYSCLVSCSQSPMLILTHDGGAHFEALPLPKLLAPNMHGNRQFQFVSPSIGFAVATNEFDPHTHFFRTVDGGKTWQVFFPRIIK